MAPRTVLVDGGGTLFPEVRSLAEAPLLRSDGALARVLPELNRQEIQRFLSEFLAAADTSTEARVQPTDDLIARVIQRIRPGLGSRARAVRAALATDGWQARQPYPGAAELLATAHRLGLKTILVSNTAWVGERDYWTHVREMGLADHLDSIVSSFDIGERKPQRAMFEAALVRAGCAPDQCVMVGDSEANDIIPAAEMGMRTIRVTVQYPVDRTSRAEAVAGSLPQAATIIKSWSQADPAPAA